MAPAPTSTRLPKAARRAQLVDAAATAFLARGFDGTSMDDVARQAGVTRLIVYRNFDSKDALYTAVLESVTELMREEFDGRDLDDVLAAGGIVGGLLGIARQRPDAFRLLWRQAAHEPDFAEFSARFRGVVDEYAMALMSRFVAPEHQRWAALTATAHVFEGICNWLDVGQPREDEEFRRRHTEGARTLVATWGGTRP
jgi:AcrR family transcriptional regulator